MPIINDTYVLPQIPHYNTDRQPFPAQTNRAIKKHYANPES